MIFYLTCTISHLQPASIGRKIWFRDDSTTPILPLRSLPSNATVRPPKENLPLRRKQWRCAHRQSCLKPTQSIARYQLHHSAGIISSHFKSDSDCHPSYSSIFDWMIYLTKRQRTLGKGLFVESNQNGNRASRKRKRPNVPSNDRRHVLTG